MQQIHPLINLFSP